MVAINLSAAARDLAGGNGKVIHLTANEHSLAINSASVQVSFMGGRPEIKFLSFKDANNHLLPQHTSLRVTLKCPMHWNNILAWINIIAKSFTIPRAAGRCHQSQGSMAQ
jgi:hypothetical protein